MLTTSTLRPGLLVSLSVRVTGGVSYLRTDLDPEHMTDEGTKEATWQTTKVVAAPEEHARALQIRSRVRAMVAGQCARSSFGLLCPSSREAKLAEVVSEARKLAADFNGAAQTTRVEVYILTGRVASDDVEATRAIGAEVRGLLADMEAGIQAASPEAIRDAANRARSLGAMLSEEVQGKVTAAINEARSAAREIVRRVGEAGETAASVVAGLRTTAIESARFAFLDLDSPAVGDNLPLPLPAPALDLAPAAAPEAPADLAAVVSPVLDLAPEALPALRAPAAPVIPVIDAA